MKALKFIVSCIFSTSLLYAAALVSYEMTPEDTGAYHKLQNVFWSVHNDFKQGLEALPYFVSSPSNKHLKMMVGSLSDEELSVEPLQLPLVIGNWAQFIAGKKEKLHEVILSNPRLLAREVEITRAFDCTVDRYYFFMRDPIAVAGHTVVEFLGIIRGRVFNEQTDYGIMITEGEEDFLSSFIIADFESAQLMAANVVRKLLYDVQKWERSHKTCVLPGYNGDWSLAAFAFGVDIISTSGSVKSIRPEWLSLLKKYITPTITPEEIAQSARSLQALLSPSSATEVAPFVPLVSVKRVPIRHVSNAAIDALNARCFMPDTEY